jgi:formylglycine-generating enzyme required for sulfatase activity
MDQPQREDSGGLADAADRQQLGRLVASRHPPQPTSAIPRRTKTKPVFLPLIVTVGFLALVLGSSLFLSFRTRLGVAPGPAKPRNVQSNTRQPYQPATKPDMVAVPGGIFKMGRDDGRPTEGPSHVVTVQDFLLDKTEVTNAEYAQFVNEANHASPEHWGNVKAPVGQELLPVSNVTYDDAIAFAEWRSKRDGVTYRLPTEEEWEYAARNGDKDNLYPWGNAWEPDRAVTQEASVGKEQPVGTYPEGRNQWGVYDLIGNVWEWTSTRASLYPGSPVKLPEQYKDWIVARGGSYSSPASKVSGTMRDWFAPNYKNPVLGFRLARSSH